MAKYMDDPIRVATMFRGKQSCTWDGIRDMLDELEGWWDEYEDEEFIIKFHTMSESEFRKLPEFDGW